MCIWNKGTLKEKRTKVKMSQTELAKALGVHWRTVQNWEKGTSILASVIPLLDKLQELYTKLFGHGFEEAHNSQADILATMRCYFELCKRGIL